MRFQVLGPLRVWDGSMWSMIGASQQRLVLAVLLTEAGRVVSTDRLIDEIWGDQPPRAATTTVQRYVMRLRRLLGSGPVPAILTRDRGYELVIDDGDLDAAVFERLVDAGRRNLAAGELETAVTQLAEGLALWRGAVLADVPAAPTVVAQATRLDEVRLGALEDRLGAQLDLGRHAEIVDELRRLVDEHPLRERLRAQHMLALYRCGRRAEALDAYQRARRVLVDELGLEPGPELASLEQAILAGTDVAPTRPPEAASGGRVAPAQLPPTVAGFTGRAAALKQLDALLDRGGDAHQVLVVSTIAGTAGVGKTALAVHWAHQVADRFPDGQLHVNLRGYAAGPPLRPIDALARFLLALGVPAEQVPTGVEEAAGLYRSLLAGKRMLVVLDNAHQPDQVRPLLPGSSGCLVLVTSRDQLGGLVARDGAVRVNLDVLTPTEAQALLARLVGADRAGAEPGAVAELARLCGHLPLALRIAAANLMAEPPRAIADYAAALIAGDRLGALQVAGDWQAGVRAAFDLSYATLPGDAQRVFRLLGLVPGPDVTAEAAAALAGIPVDRSVRLMRYLADAHLLDQRIPGRYSLHDLVRLYAAEQTEADDPEPERLAALDRLYEYYLRALDVAGDRLYPHILRLPRCSPAGPGGPEFADHTEALTWLEAERPNLVAAVTHAAAHGPHRAAWRLADALRGFLYVRMHTVDWLTVAEAGLAAAEADGDLYAQAAAQLSNAGLHWITARFGVAIARYTAALELSRQAGWIEGEAATLGNLGVLYWRRGQLRRAADHFVLAQAIDERLGRPASLAVNLGNLALVRAALGRLEEAAELHSRSRYLHQRSGSRGGEASALGSLGETYHDLGRFPEAVDMLMLALALHREVGDQNGEAEAIRFLAVIRRDTGRRAEAQELSRAALALAEETGDRRSVAEALVAQASVYGHIGDHEQALRGNRRALELARHDGYRYTEAEALTGLGTSLRLTGRLGLAGMYLRQALAVAGRAGFRMLEGNARTELAALHLDRGQPAQALRLCGWAIAVHRETGHRLALARTHLVAAHALRALHRHREARAHRQRALTIFAETGAPPGEHARVTIVR